MTVFRGTAWKRRFCIRERMGCMPTKRETIWRARGPLYIEEIRALERRRPLEAADGLEARGKKEAFVA